MKYSSEKPTKPGWYWWRESAADKPTILNIQSRNDGGLVIVAEDANDGEGAEIEIDQWEFDWGGQFAGPIPEPGAHFIDRLKAAGVELKSEEEAELRAKWSPDSAVMIEPITKKWQIYGRKI